MNVIRNNVKIERTEFYVEVSILDIINKPTSAAAAVYDVAWDEITKTYPHAQREDFTERTYERGNYTLLVGFFQQNIVTQDYPNFVGEWTNSSREMKK